MNSCIPSPQVYTVCLRGGQETRQRSLTRKRRATACSLRCQGMFECLLPGFGRFRKVLLTLFTVLFHTRWVCGSEEGGADGFGFTGGTGGFDFMTSRSRCSRHTGDQLNVWIQTCVLYLPVWMQLVAKVWMEVEAFPGEEKEIQPRILENQPTNQTKPKAIIVPRNKITNISKFCMQLTSALMLEGGVNDLTI